MTEQEFYDSEMKDIETIMEVRPIGIDSIKIKNNDNINKNTIGKHLGNRNSGILCKINNNIVKQYSGIKKDIEEYQEQIRYADKLTRRKLRRLQLKNKIFPLSNTKSVKVRKDIVGYMEEDGFLIRCIKLFMDFQPIIRILGSLVSLLITAILSLDIVKRSISKETLEIMDKLIKISTGISNTV